ncbi:hypothetical protein U1R68_00320 [Pectobacterium colocasium]|uniref:hypothetical protein n=1 Tax=Pectobacterium colocasium TaxID=2878098 RepID=UPI001CD5079E|nr:hypothetical protein [Pectobacterium colocasium]
MIDDERMTYKELRDMFLSCFYDCCRNKLQLYIKTGEKNDYDGEEIGYASYQFENTPFIPIEKLMLNVFKLILIAGRETENVEDSIRKSITTILAENSLEELIKDIGEDEKKDLLYDMQLLRLIEKKPK